MPALSDPRTATSKNCFGHAWTAVRVKIRRVRISSRHWICTAFGAVFRFRARITFAMWCCGVAAALDGREVLDGEAGVTFAFGEREEGGRRVPC